MRAPRNLISGKILYGTTAILGVFSLFPVSAQAQIPPHGSVVSDVPLAGAIIPAPSSFDPSNPALELDIRIYIGGTNTLYPPQTVTQEILELTVGTQLITVDISQYCAWSTVNPEDLFCNDIPVTLSAYDAGKAGVRIVGRYLIRGTDSNGDPMTAYHAFHTQIGQNDTSVYNNYGTEPGPLPINCDRTSPSFNLMMCMPCSMPMDPLYDPTDAICDAWRPGFCADETDPLLPVSSGGSFTFTFDPGQMCEDIFFIDPPVAAGYDYSVTGGSFGMITAPTLNTVNDPDGYLIEWTDTNGAQSQTITAGQTLTFTPPVTAFSLSGIDPSLQLDPSDGSAFALGVDVIPDFGATVQIEQTPVTTDWPPLAPPNGAPVADAGEDQFVFANQLVLLNGDGSQDPDGDTLTYSWTQVSGPGVTLSGGSNATANFQTGMPSSTQIREFELTVTDPDGETSSDRVMTTVYEQPAGCPGWGQADLLTATRFDTAGAPTGYYALRVFPEPDAVNLLNEDADDLRALKPDFKWFQLITSASYAGNGFTPNTQTVPNDPNDPGVTPLDSRFAGPLSYQVANPWTGYPFMVDHWYRIDTKLNTVDQAGNLVKVFPDNCLYQTAYVRLGTDGQSHVIGPDEIASLTPPAAPGDGLDDMIVWRASDSQVYWRASSENFGAIKQTGWGSPGDVPLSRTDLDGDGLDDLVFWRPGNPKFAVALAPDFTDVAQIPMGTDQDEAVPDTDLNGDGADDLVLFDDAKGRWTVRLSPDFDQVQTWTLGQSGDVILPGSDFDGDGADDLAVWRPSNGTWYAKTSSSGFAATQSWQWGTQGDVPVAGSDFNGDGKADLAVMRPGSGTYFMRPSLPIPNLYGGPVNRGLGQSGDMVLPNSDFDGDGRADMAVWRPSNGMWYIRTSSSNFNTLSQHQWGTAGDQPLIAADFNGDGRDDLAVWRPGSGTVFTRLSIGTGVQFGAPLNRGLGQTGDVLITGRFE